jgi:hypothetical protein
MRAWGIPRTWLTWATGGRWPSTPRVTGRWPTHGAGSFCSAPPGAARVTTIGAEKAANPLLAAPDEDGFARRLLASLGSYPVYFARLGEVNRRGPGLLTGDAKLAPLTPAALRSQADRGGWVIDVRPVADFAAGHVPARSTSSSATCPPGRRTRPSGRW